MHCSQDHEYRTQDTTLPSLTNELRGPVYGTALQAGALHDDINIHAPAPMTMRHQLPSSPTYFVDRNRELHELKQIVSAATRSNQKALVCLVGLGGVGKTGLATRFLQGLTTDVEGYFFADLRGFSRDETAHPTDVLTTFLRALGVPPQTIPPDLASRAAWWRSATTGRPLAILLDNAASAAQVRALLPGTGSHVVLVTSRTRLAGLTIDGGRLLHLDPLDPADTTELLSRLSDGLHTHAERESAQRVAQLCGGLPIAVNSVAVQTASGRPLATVEAYLSRRRGRLSALSSSEDELTSVRAAFDLSYEALSPELARTYRRLGWHVGPDITVAVARALAGCHDEECEHHLHALASASLLDQIDTDRYRLHDLLALHARLQAATDEPPQEERAALGRLAHAHAEQAQAADRLLRPYASAHPRAEEPVFAEAEQALSWLEGERANLIALAEYAGAHGHTTAAVGIAEGMWPLYLHHRDAAGWLRAAQSALNATTEARTRGRLLSKQGLALGVVGRNDDAHAAFDQSERIWEELGDRWRVSQTRQRRGLLALGSGHPTQATTHLRAALELQEGLDHPHDLAITLLGLGRALVQSAHPEQARALLGRAVRLLVAAGDANHEIRARIALAHASIETDPDHASNVLATALETARQRGSLVGCAEAHEALGDLAARHGGVEHAREHYQAAMELLAHMGSHTIAAQIQQRLARLAE